MITIENEILRVQITEYGAELQSIFHKKNDIEYLWQGDPAVWYGRSPLLFPNVGRLEGDKITVDGTVYPLMKHGFARKSTFTVLTQTKNSVDLTITSTEETLTHYPYSFRLIVRYTVEGNRLETRYLVQNTGNGDMYFCIGGHPGFNVPLQDGAGYEDYYLEFSEAEPLTTYKLDPVTTMFTDKMESVEQDGKKLWLKTDLFADDALVFHQLKSQKVTLKTDKNPRAVQVDFREFPWIGFWSNHPSTGYVCIEPWFGHDDEIGYAGEWKDKEGMQYVAAEGEWSAAFTAAFI